MVEEDNKSLNILIKKNHSPLFCSAFLSSMHSYQHLPLLAGRFARCSNKVTPIGGAGRPLTRGGGGGRPTKISRAAPTKSRRHRRNPRRGGRGGLRPRWGRRAKKQGRFLVHGGSDCRLLSAGRPGYWLVRVHYFFNKQRTPRSSACV